MGNPEEVRGDNSVSRQRQAGGKFQSLLISFEPAGHEVVQSATDNSNNLNIISVPYRVFPAATTLAQCCLSSDSALLALLSLGAG